MAAPSVYSAINAIAAELSLAGVPKSHINPVEQYAYRSIDDVLDRLAPLLAKHRLCVLPRVLEREVCERTGLTDELLVGVSVRAEFTLVSVDDGSSHLVEAYGEALDAGDKGTAKAMSSAFKYAMIQTFCIPVRDIDDADAVSHKLAAKTHVAEPVQGWEQWTRDMTDIVSVCESEQAINTVQSRNRELLKALSRERSELYAELGHRFSERRDALSARTKLSQAASEAGKPKRRPRKCPESADA